MEKIYLNFFLVPSKTKHLENCCGFSIEIDFCHFAAVKIVNINYIQSFLLLWLFSLWVATKVVVFFNIENNMDIKRTKLLNFLAHTFVITFAGESIIKMVHISHALFHNRAC